MQRWNPSGFAPEWIRPLDLRVFTAHAFLFSHSILRLDELVLTCIPKCGMLWILTSIL